MTPPQGRFELGTDGPGAILVGVDGSATSLRAAAYAAGLARRQRTRLIAAYVRGRPGPLVGLADQAGEAVTAAYAAEDEVEGALRSALQRQSEVWSVEATLVVREGDPLQELVRLAADVRAESVVVGSSASLGHRLVGSLAVRLMRCGRWPVTVVP